MAKWGEGDPRWIVEERPDAVNVNNWHWTEKNASLWSQNKFKELFSDFKVIHDLFKMRVTEVVKATGEANAHNRKGKLFFFYEWELSLKWRGKPKGCDDYITGKVLIPNLSEENDLHEIVVEITVETNTEEAQQMKELMHAHSQDKFREQLGKYIKCLKEEFTQGMILPKKGDESNAPNNVQSLNNLSSGLKEKMSINNIARTENETQVDLTNLDLTHKFQCTPSELYNALTVPDLVKAFTNGPVQLDLRPGGKFDLFNGNIVGEYIEIVPNKRIVQKWRIKSWPKNINTTVTIEIKEESDHTLLFLKQTGLPYSESETTKINWERYYWEPIQRKFGFGAFL